jgi:tripartite-type tricarboxylate transporter receptor subunit TctC
MIQDLVAGQIDLTFTQVASALAQVRAGQLKAYAVMAKTRWAATPDTPTIDEAGVPGLHASFWHGLWAPKGTPKDVLAKLHAAVVETLGDPSVRQRFTDVGQEIWPREKQTPRRSPRSRRLRLRSGGRSSRRRTSRRSESSKLM